MWYTRVAGGNERKQTFYNVATLRTPDPPSTYRDIQRRKSIALPPNENIQGTVFHIKTL